MTDPIHQAGTATVGVLVWAVGTAIEQEAGAWIGLALLIWSGVLAGYDRWRAVKRRNDRLDREASAASEIDHG